MDALKVEQLFMIDPESPERRFPDEDNAIANIMRELTPSTRRDFLWRLASAGIGIALPSRALSQTDEPSPPPSGDSVPQNLPLSLRVNGKTVTIQAEARTTLLDFLRDSLGLTGAKKGCDHGQCGACTVLVNGRRINSCLTLAVMHDGDTITTVEGLAQDGQLQPLQEAFIRHDALQCGFCTSGQLCSGVACLSEGHANGESEIREWMSGNICRCGAYPNIVAAIQELHQGTR
jgi:xanthine dehydrogenase YagT iron-sulfur-binding subunit